MERKLLMTICIIGMISGAASVIFAAIEKQYTGSIFYLILFFINTFGFYTAKEEK